MNNESWDEGQWMREVMTVEQPAYIKRCQYSHYFQFGAD